MRRNPRAARFNDLRAVLEGRGFVAQPGKADHWKFWHEALTYPLVIDPRRPYILPVYVRQALAAIDEVEKKLGASDE